MLDLYRMIVTEKGAFPEYEAFYTLYSQSIKMNVWRNLILWQI